MSGPSLLQTGDQVEILNHRDVGKSLAGKKGAVTKVLADRVTVEITGWFSGNFRPEVLKKISA